MAGRRRWAALDFHTPLRGHGKHKKKKNNNQLARRRHVGAAEGLQGVMEVTPYCPGPNYGGAAAPGGLRPPPPSPGSWKTPKKTNNNQLACRPHVGGTEGLQGVMEVIPYRPGPNYGGVRSPDCRKLLPPSPGSKNTQKNSNNNHLV